MESSLKSLLLCTWKIFSMKTMNHRRRWQTICRRNPRNPPIDFLNTYFLSFNRILFNILIAPRRELSSSTSSRMRKESETFFTVENENYFSFISPRVGAHCSHARSHHSSPSYRSFKSVERLFNENVKFL